MDLTRPLATVSFLRGTCPGQSLRQRTSLHGCKHAHVGSARVRAGRRRAGRFRPELSSTPRCASSSAAPSAAFQAPATGWPTCTSWWNPHDRSPEPIERLADDAPDAETRRVRARLLLGGVQVRSPATLSRSTAGIGITGEHDIHPGFKRARVVPQPFRQPHEALRRLLPLTDASARQSRPSTCHRTPRRWCPHLHRSRA